MFPFYLYCAYLDLMGKGLLRSVIAGVAVIALLASCSSEITVKRFEIHRQSFDACAFRPIECERFYYLCEGSLDTCGFDAGSESERIFGMLGALEPESVDGFAVDTRAMIEVQWSDGSQEWICMDKEHVRYREQLYRVNEVWMALMNEICPDRFASGH
jgi:hypothetical protein